jgi:hypothetical protein
MPAAACCPTDKNPLIESRRQIRISELVRLKQSIYYLPLGDYTDNPLLIVPDSHILLKQANNIELYNC